MLRITRAALKHPRSVLAGWLLILALSVPFALQLDGSLSAGGFTNPRAEALVTQTTVEEAFGDEPNQLLIAVDADAPLGDSSLPQLVEPLKEAGATTIQTPADNPDFLSSDGRTALIMAGFPGDNTSIQNKVPDLQKAVENKIPGASVYVTGQPALDYQLNVHSKEDATRAEMIVFPILIIVLLLVFRSVAATLVPLLMAGTALGVASAIGFAVTRFTEISILYSNIVSMIGLAVAVDYSLFIIKRYREELDAGNKTGAALAVASATAGRSVIFSGVAVAVALVALFIPNVMAFTSIALGGVVVTLIAIALSITVLPAALSLLGHRINWGTVRLPTRFQSRPARSAGPAGGKRPRVLAAAGIAAMLLVALPVLGISLQSPVASATVLPAGDPARTGLETIEERIGHKGLFPVQVVLSTEDSTPLPDVLATVERVSDYAGSQPGVAAVTSLTSGGVTGEQLAAALATPAGAEGAAGLWAHEDGRYTTRILVDPSEGPDSVRAHQLVSDLRSHVDEAAAGYTTGVTGATAQGVDFDNTLIESIPLIAGVVFVLTFLMLAFAFRSIILPVLALFFNTLVLLASLGLLTGIVSAASNAPLNSVTPVLLFAVMFGLSMDYMVIIIARIVEAFGHGKPFTEAVTSGVRGTRSMINSAAIIMVAVFASFSSAQISIVREIGIGLAIAVILDALVVRMFIMPAVLRVLGPRVLGPRKSQETELDAAVPEKVPAPV
ncbi:MMPL family transporter [Pseudarthrobacter sp. NPDC058329]|uniref:MMPL family transporter n=1 Tax=Pseudarthrobacter sp. NPDC058329 TaxID=3346448 RepID=UPI0036D8444E